VRGLCRLDTSQLQLRDDSIVGSRPSFRVLTKFARSESSVTFSSAKGFSQVTKSIAGFYTRRIIHLRDHS
jgi:hypothetical protein